MEFARSKLEALRQTAEASDQSDASFARSRADLGPAGPHPAFLSLDALHADHEVPNVGTAVNEGVRLPRLAGSKRGDSVGLAVDEGLIAVGMIGDIPIHAGLFSRPEEAIE